MSGPKSVTNQSAPSRTASRTVTPPYPMKASAGGFAFNATTGEGGRHNKGVTIEGNPEAKAEPRETEGETQNGRRMAYRGKRRTLRTHGEERRRSRHHDEERAGRCVDATDNGTDNFESLSQVFRFKRATDTT